MSEIISSDLDESQESIFWCKKSGFPPFGRRLASLYTNRESILSIKKIPLCKFAMVYIFSGNEIEKVIVSSSGIFMGRLTLSLCATERLIMSYQLRT